MVNKLRGTQQIINFGQSFIQEYQAAQAKTSVPIIKSNEKWKPPTGSLLKLNVDAVFCNERAAMGVIVRDGNGEVEAVMMEILGQCFDAEQSETMAFLKALQWAKEVGLIHFQLEGDTLGVVRKILCRQKELSMTGHIIAAIKDLRKEFPAAHVNHVCRQNNKPAHTAAKTALSVADIVVSLLFFSSRTPRNIVYMH